MFHNNIGKCGPIFKMLSPGFCEEILYMHMIKISIWCAIPCESRKSKNFTKFSCWMWQL